MVFLFLPLSRSVVQFSVVKSNEILVLSVLTTDFNVPFLAYAETEGVYPNFEDVANSELLVACLKKAIFDVSKS